MWPPLNRESNSYIKKKLEDQNYKPKHLELTAHVLSQPHVCENTLKPEIPNPSRKTNTAASRVLDKAKTKTHIKTKRKIERDNVSRNVYEKTRQSRGFEAVKVTRGHVWCLGCCAPCHSLCSSLPLWWKRRAQARVLDPFFLSF